MQCIFSEDMETHRCFQCIYLEYITHCMRVWRVCNSSAYSIFLGKESLAYLYDVSYTFVRIAYMNPSVIMSLHLHTVQCMKRLPPRVFMVNAKSMSLNLNPSAPHYTRIWKSFICVAKMKVNFTYNKDSVRDIWASLNFLEFRHRFVIVS